MLSRVFTRRFSVTLLRASGHSKWSKIKSSKGAADKARASQYSKSIREIESAVRIGRGSVDPDLNSHLANAIKRAKAAGLPKDNIENALKRAAGAATRGGQSVTYEAMLSGKIPLLIECVTDNATRTHHALRDIINSHGARLANVAFMFQRQGYAVVTGEPDAEETLINIAIDFYADDVSSVPKEPPEQEGEDGNENENEWKVMLLPEKVDDFVDAIGHLQPLTVVDSGVEQACTVKSDEVADSLDKLRELVDELEEEVDVVRVWTVQ